MMGDDSSWNARNWSLENGYDDKTDKTSYPRRIFNSRSDSSLRVELFLADDKFFSCADKRPGFRLFFHVPGEVAKMSRQFQYVTVGENIEFSIKATLITTSDGLRNYKPSQRQCFFNFDRQLRFFKIYTQNNCEAECLANFTNIECGCVKYSMPSTTTFPMREAIFLSIFFNFRR